MKSFGRILLAMFLALCAAAPPAFAWTLGTCATPVRINGASTGSIAVTASSGNLLVFMIERIGSTNHTIISGFPQDTNGTPTAALAYTEINANSVWNGMGVYYELSAASGSHSLSVSFSTSGTWALFACPYSYSGTAALDATGSSIQTGNSASFSTPSLTPSQGGDLIIAPVAINIISGTFSGWTSGFVPQQLLNTTTAPSGTWADLEGDGGSASISTSGSISGSGTWESYIVAFKVGGGGPSAQKAASGFLSMDNL